MRPERPPIPSPHRAIAPAPVDHRGSSSRTGAPLAEIIKKELEAFTDYISVSGCDLLVNTLAAQQFAMIVHELATNASKYGALSAATGMVAIEGKIERVNGEQIFAIAWRESGGPRVRKPRRRGFAARYSSRALGPSEIGRAHV